MVKIVNTTMKCGGMLSQHCTGADCQSTKDEAFRLTESNCSMEAKVNVGWLYPQKEGKLDEIKGNVKQTSMAEAWLRTTIEMNEKRMNIGKDEGGQTRV